MDIFMEASRQAIRYTTDKGVLSVEQLWKLPLTSTVGAVNLNDLAVGIYNGLKSDEISFVDKAKKADPTEQLKLDVLRTVIEFKIAENDAKAKERVRSAEEQQILAALEKRELSKYDNMSADELKAALAKLKTPA